MTLLLALLLAVRSPIALAADAPPTSEDAPALVVPARSLPPFQPFSRVGVLGLDTSRDEVLAALGKPDRTRSRGDELYWGCEDRRCYRSAVEVDLVNGHAWRIWLGPHLDAETRASVFGPGGALPAEVLGLTEAELSDWIGAPPVGRGTFNGEPEAYRTGTKANWGWEVGWVDVAMHVHFGADGRAADARWELRPAERKAVREMTRVQPEYPLFAQLLSIERSCAVTIQTDVEGVPTKVTGMNCPRLFRASATAAAMASRFYPYIEDGEAVPVEFTYRYVFRLR